jgi:hypothetical protein
MERGKRKEEVLFGGVVILGRSLSTPCILLGDGYIIIRVF